MKFLPLFQQLFTTFFMRRVENAAIHGAYFNTFGGCKPANAFSALSGVDYVYWVRFFDSFVLAFRLAGAAVNAFVSDFVRHFLT